MQKEKPTKVYTGSKNQKPKKPKKEGPGFFDTVIKSAKFVVSKAMAGSVQHIAILVAAGVLTVAVLGGAVWGVTNLIGGSGQGPATNEIEIDPEADNKYDKNAAVIDTSKYASTILQETADAGQQYISETLFVGDSNTVRSLMYDVTGNTWENVVGAVGIGIQHVASSPFPCVTFTQPTDPVDIVTAIKWIQPKRVVFTFGTNNASWTVDSFIEEYKKAIDAAYEAYPYFDVIVNAIPPVDKIRDYPNVTMQQIDAFNAALAQMCEDEGYKYLNSAEALKDEETGFAKKDYTIGDGIHLSKNGFTALYDYIRTHAYETEDRRPELTYCPKRNEIEMPTIIEDPVAIRGGLKVIFTSNDYSLGSVDGEVEQYVKYTKTSDAVTAVAKSENGGIFTGWSCEYNGISDPGASTITFTAPQLSEEITTVTITANFKKGDVDISDHSMTLKVGQSKKLSAEASGGHKIEWSSSNKNVATVSSDGTVKAVGAGTAKITASALDGQMSASCTVTVQPEATPTPAVLQKIEISPKTTTELKVGDTLDIKVVTTPENAQLGTVVWTSSKPEVATVAANGATNKITAVKAGKTTITASTNDGKLTDKIEITVVDKTVDVTGFDITVSSSTIDVNGTSQITVSNIKPDNATSKTPSYSSSSESVAKVDSNGKVTGIAAGKAIITVKIGSISKTVEITVKAAAAATKCEYCGGDAHDRSACAKWCNTCSTSGHDESEAHCADCSKYGHADKTSTSCEKYTAPAAKCEYCGGDAHDKSACASWCNTCSTSGHDETATHCSSCGKYGHADNSSESCSNYVAPHTHSYSEEVSRTEPTCGADGSRTLKCSCGETTTETLSATGNHSWQEATYDAPKTCSVCSKTEGSKLERPVESEPEQNNNGENQEG